MPNWMISFRLTGTLIFFNELSVVQNSANLNFKD